MEALREELRALHGKRVRGDISEKAFQRTLAERTVALYRAAVTARLAQGESILADHHAVQGHLKLNQSVLKEPEQTAISLFATDRRLIRLRAALHADASPTCDERDRTVIDDVPYEEIRAVRLRRQVRVGEAIAGAVICVVAVLGARVLAVTGPLLLVLGVAGIVHGLLFPTRWWEVQVPGRPAEQWMCVHAVRKRSARDLVRLLRSRTVLS
jgi:hypothetical protein